MGNTAKKGLMVLVLVAIVAGGVFAQVPGFAVGARAIGILPFYAPNSDFVYALTGGNSGVSVDFKGDIGFGFAAQASFNFFSLLGVQAEVIYNSDNVNVSGSYMGSTQDGGTFKTTSLLIPVLVRVGLPVGPVHLTAVAGPYYTLVLGDMEVKDPSGAGIKSDWEASLGAMAGGILGIPIGPGALFADVRYAYDFAEVKAKATGRGLYQKGAIHCGVGYALQFGRF
jgi:opacity protein-like surface antigen